MTTCGMCKHWKVQSGNRGMCTCPTPFWATTAARTPVWFVGADTDVSDDRCRCYWARQDENLFEDVELGEDFGAVLKMPPRQEARGRRYHDG